MKLNRLFAVVTAFLIAAGIAHTVRADEPPIKIGFAVALSGWMVPYDNQYQAAEFAIEEVNARGGILGRQIQTIYADTKTDIVQGTNAAAEVVDKGADIIVVSSDYDFGGPGALVANDANLINFSGAADPLFGPVGLGPLSFSYAVAAQVQGAVIGEWGYHQKGWRKAHVLLDTFVEYNKSVCAGFEYVWNNLEGATIVGQDTFKNDDQSVASQITRLKSLAEQPDVIMLCSFPPGGALVARQFRAAGIDTPFINGTGMDGNYWLNSAPNLSEFYVPTPGSIHGDDPNPALEELNKRAEAKFGNRPPNGYYYSGYALIELLTRAIERAGGVDSAALAAEFEKFDEEPTIVGPMSYTTDLHIQRKGRFLVVGIQRGKPQSIEYWTNAIPIPDEVLYRVK